MRNDGMNRSPDAKILVSMIFGGFSMKRLVKTCAIAAIGVSLTAVLSAEVKTREKGLVKFEGMLGTAARIFGGKAAKDGVLTTTAVKGDRKVQLNDATGRIVDLKEEKVYELDIKDKSYKVKTFAQIRQELKEAQEKAQRQAEEARKQEGKGEQPQQKPEKEVDVDFDLKETGQKKSIAGYDAREVVMTVTVREKGKTLEDSGGLVMTTNSWLGPEIPALKELAEFEMRYWKAVAPETAGVSAEQMVMVLAMYPMVKSAMERMNKEKVNMSGTPLATTSTLEGVKGKEEMAQAQEQNRGGGIGGMLARRMMKKDDKPRTLIMTLNTETLEVATAVAAADLEIPAGFKEKK
jgi:hypothetical protein